MRKSICFLLRMFGLIIIIACFGMAYAGSKKVTICHYPPGNSNNPQTITVSENALKAHLMHGDQIGECPTGCQAGQFICDDWNFCTSDICLPSGECDYIPVDCDDGNPCTQDLCDPAIGCLNPPDDGVFCDDGNACTEGDICINTECIGEIIAGCCITNSDCDDNDPCTVDICNGNSCTNEPVDCTVTDKCLIGFCIPTSGACETAPRNCDDSNICTDDFCDRAIGCFSEPTTDPPEPIEVSCSDGLDNDCDGAVDCADSDCAFDQLCLVPPAPPTGVSGCGFECMCCDPWWVSWDPVPSATFYQVHWKCSINPEQVFNVGNVTSVFDVCNDIDMCNGVCVFGVGYIRVSACNASGCSVPVDVPASEIPISCGGGCCC